MPQDGLAELNKQLLRVVQHAEQLQWARDFRSPVDPYEYPDYADVVKQPMSA